MNIGLIGCGRIADIHAQIYNAGRDAKLVAVCDENLEKARPFATRNRVERYFQDYLDLIEMKNLDFVDVCTPTSTHALIAIDCIKSGLDVLIEKPMALHSKECAEIISEANKHDARVCVCHNQIFFPSIRRVKALIDQHAGGLLSFKTFIKEDGALFPSWTTTASEGGVLWEAGYHLAYLHLFFLKQVEEVFAMGQKVKYPVHDNFSVLLKTGSQSYGIIELSWAAKEMEKFYEFDMADGRRIQIDPNSDYLLDAPPKIVDAALFKTRLVFSAHLPSRFTRQYYRGHFLLLNSFMNSLKNDLPMPVSLTEGMRTVQLLESIQESLDGKNIARVAS